MDYSQIISTISTSLVQIAVVVITCFVTPSIIKLIMNLSEKMGVSVDQTKLEAKSIELQEIVIKAVNYANQTYVDALKAEDKFTKSNYSAAMKKAIEAAKKMMSNDLLDELSETYDDLDEMLKVMIEDTIKTLKDKNTITTTTEVEEEQILDLETVEETVETIDEEGAGAEGAPEDEVKEEVKSKKSKKA